MPTSRDLRRFNGAAAEDFASEEEDYHFISSDSELQFTNLPQQEEEEAAAPIEPLPKSGKKTKNPKTSSSKKKKRPRKLAENPPSEPLARDDVSPATLEPLFQDGNAPSASLQVAVATKPAPASLQVAVADKPAPASLQVAAATKLTATSPPRAGAEAEAPFSDQRTGSKTEREELEALRLSSALSTLREEDFELQMAAAKAKYDAVLSRIAALLAAPAQATFHSLPNLGVESSAPSVALACQLVSDNRAARALSQADLAAAEAELVEQSARRAALIAAAAADASILLEEEAALKASTMSLKVARHTAAAANANARAEKVLPATHAPEAQPPPSQPNLPSKVSSYCDVALQQLPLKTKRAAFLPELPAFPGVNLQQKSSSSDEESSTSNSIQACWKDSEFTGRIEAMIRQGHSMTDAAAALHFTRECGVFSLRLAIGHLQERKERSAAEALQKAKDAALKLDPHGEVNIKPDGAVEAFLATRPDTADIVSFAMVQHNKRRTGHHKSAAVAVAQLLTLAEVANSPQANRLGTETLSAAAHAVVEDCARCDLLRDKEAAQKAEAAAKKLAAEQKEKALQQHRLQMAEAALTDRSKHASAQPVVLNFRLKDCRRDVTLKHGKCGRCRIGAEGGKWLVYCDFCNGGHHEGCETICLLVHTITKKELWACPSCKQLKTDTSQASVIAGEYLIADHNLDANSAPRFGPAEIPTSPSRNPAVMGSLLAHYGGTVAPARQGTNTPPLPDQDFSPGGRETTPNDGHKRSKPDFGSGTQSHQRSLDFSTGNTEIGSNPNDRPKSGPQPDQATTTPVMRMEDYTRWEDTPKGHKISEVHLTKGWGKIPYHNWRRINVSKRDACKNTRNDLGALALRALTTEMRQCIGGNLLSERTLWHHCAEVHRLNNLKTRGPLWRPVTPPLNFAELADKDIDNWVDLDPLYDWVGRIPDDELLGLLDKRFGVHKPDLFLSKKFPSNLPKVLPNGDINYCCQEFVTWSSEWQAERNELVASGCDLSGIDMKQTLLNAISTHTIIHNAATQYSSNSIHHILCHLRQYLRGEEETQASQRTMKEKLLNGGNEPTPAIPGAAIVPSPRAAQTAGGGVRAGALATGAAPRSLPSHFTAIPTGKSAKCNGCGIVYDLSKTAQCYKECRFGEHPRFNHELKTREWKAGEPCISWKNFRAEYPGRQLPAQFISWETWTNKTAAEKRSKYESSKRPREKP